MSRRAERSETLEPEFSLLAAPYGAAMFMAAVAPSRMACWAVGGTIVPATVLTGHAVKVGEVAQSDDQVIVFEVELARAEPGLTVTTCLFRSISSISRTISLVHRQRRLIGETTLVRPIDPEMTSGSTGWYTQ